MTDRYADLRDLLDLTQTNVFNRDDVRALLADYDEAERALILTGKVNKDLMDTVLKLRKFIENEARKAERGGRVSLAKRCRAALAQEQGCSDAT